ncbi:S24 family peptidase [Methylopila sp. 73B]|uniref:XRE family transcriptional regulator n=1 Tax=Methylopila sp. 73B TaxID=1120792 RepID=UPI00036D316A|nr:S24 family peptidase [Methylopila sp. 73B]
MAKLTTLADKVRHIRTVRGMSQQSLGVFAGVTQQSIEAIESGRTKQPRSIVEIAGALGVNPAMLVNDQVVLDTEALTFEPVPLSRASKPSEIEPAEHAPDHASLRQAPQDVPVLGTAEGGAVGDFTLNGETIDYVRRPPGIARAKDVFALYITGQSMYPRFNEGELVYVSTARPPAIGDDVIVELHPENGDAAGPGFIKRLAKRTPTKIIVEQFNPPAQVEFDRAEVRSLFRIIPWPEVLGI